MRALRFKLEAAAFRMLLLLSRVVPRRVLLAAGAVAGQIGYLVDGRHRQVAIDNLRHAFPQLTPAEARTIGQACWRHFGRITFDALSFPRLGPDAVGRVVHYEGLEHIREAYGRGRGVLLFSGHYGHWELIAMMQGYLGMPLALVARPLDNPDLERLLTRLRSVSGNRIIYKRSAVREMMKALKQGLGVAIVLDQDARERGVFVPFFGRPASTTPTLALLALRSGAAIVPTYSVPRPDGSYRVVYEPEIAAVSTGDLDRDVLSITAECTARIEAWVRERPELWLWMHRRWKTPAPPGAA